MIKKYDPSIHVDTEEHVHVKFLKDRSNFHKGYVYKKVARFTAEEQLSKPTHERAHAWRGVSYAKDVDPEVKIENIPGAQALIDKEVEKEVQKRLAEIKPSENIPGAQAKKEEAEGLTQAPAYGAPEYKQFEDKPKKDKSNKAETKPAE